MKVNYRRRNGRHNPKSGGGGSAMRISTAVKDLSRRIAKATERRLMAVGDYDSLPMRIPKSNLWESW